MAGEESGSRTVTAAQAARHLELRRDEFRLATQLGLVRTVAPGAAAGRGAGGGAAVGAGPPERGRVEMSELDRLKGAPDFPDGLRERVRAVGTREAATLLSVTPERFTKLARTGHVSPVRFYLNRYRAVVWLYLAGEVGEFARAHPELLTGRLPPDVRERLAAGQDTRARNCRSRRLSLLLRTTTDAWGRAAAVASLLDPDELPVLVADPYERSHLDRLRPSPSSSGLPASPAARDIVRHLSLADEADEILWLRGALTDALAEARAVAPLAGPAAPGPVPSPGPLRAGPHDPLPAESLPWAATDRVPTTPPRRLVPGAVPRTVPPPGATPEPVRAMARPGAEPHGAPPVHPPPPASSPTGRRSDRTRPPGRRAGNRLRELLRRRGTRARVGERGWGRPSAWP
ncbi:MULTISPECIES: DUF6397 family protein [unclassified Streptomyces]|uniref:DUF6397 family protein n=1 Tax=unclassified Streptomyces TaxID=2593676 RepID=UPI0036B34114